MKGDLVSAEAKVFDGDEPGSFSNKCPDTWHGTVTRGPGSSGMCRVCWVNDGTTTEILAKDLVLVKRKTSADVIMAICMQVGDVAMFEAADKSSWPKDFFSALVKSDWRRWVEAVKKEIDAWDANDTYEMILASDMTPGASVVPLGELYTRKKDQSYKFRQYLMGQLLKKGIDYRDTFSTTISWDGVRWFASVANACQKRIYGHDAITGYLQAPERFDIYAYCPSHELYSRMTYEELAVFRKELLDLVAIEGQQGLKKFADKHRREARNNPKHVLKINRSIYGNPGAGHEFEMLMQGAHIKNCGLTQTEIEPSLYVKFQVDADDKVVEYLFVKGWTDDFRHFGTDGLRAHYEDRIGRAVKMKYLGECSDFVGVSFKHDMERDLMELSSPDYWLKAGKIYQQHFPSGFKNRESPMTPADEKVMMEQVTDEQHEAAKHLPFRQLCGTISYPASCVKLEMRYAVSLCGTHRGKWGIRQWNVLKKVFEYGHYTRELGLMYSRGLDPHGINTLYAYSDASHQPPRSQGCTCVLLNGAAVAVETKKHTVTGTSTCHDELIQFKKGGCKVLGFRNLMQEGGMYQQAPATVYQDNQATIKVLENRGSLSARTRHIDLDTLAARNMVEDQLVKPVYKCTAQMVADFGTKALPEEQFKLFRDIVNGYGLVKHHMPDVKVPSMVVDPWTKKRVNKS